MATLNTIQRTINFASAFGRLAPFTGVGGFANEPAFSIGDWVRQFVLAPPFAWRWNRNTTTIPLTAGTQDYGKALADFGWIEKATVTDANQNVYELEVKMVLASDTQQNLPTHLSAYSDDNAGNITFRFLPIPNAAYTATIVYQKAPPSFTTLSDTWAPLPDYLSYLYNQGFLAKALEYLDDPRSAFATQLFLRQVVAANAGLADTQINIFLNDRLDSERQVQGLQGSQLGRQARGGF